MILKWNKSALTGKVTLPASKSISNRALIISALSENPFPIENLSGAEDTQNLVKNLELLRQHNDGPLTLDVGPAGTNMRFLTALLSIKPGAYILKGTERMHQRPVKPLVDALTDLGAEIEYLEKEGYPPLQIKGNALSAKKVKLPADVSSQFISALMMIGPAMDDGLEIILEGQPVSFSYIQMTAAMMSTCGADVEIVGNRIVVKGKPYKREQFYAVEADWSAASYWYGMLALAEEGWITLPGLSKDSLQGDHLLSEWMVPFGVLTEFGDDGVTIRKTVSEPFTFDKDFTLVPDLAQTFLVVLAAKGYEGRLIGLKTLRIKETDRLEAVKAELKKCGVELRISEDTATIKPQKMLMPASPVQTYHDHRMAMAFAMLAIKTKAIEIQNPEVVSKSYPAFWEELEKVGMEINS